MKRTITCPKCEAKLAVFDLGKPINQKCPKCGNTFVVDSEEKKDAVKEPEVKAEKKEETVSVPVADEKAQPQETPADKKPKDILVKPAVAPAAKPSTPVKREPSPAVPVAEPELQAAGGHSLLFPVVVVGLLLVLAIMQVMAKKQADRQYESLLKHLQHIEKSLIK